MTPINPFTASFTQCPLTYPQKRNILIALSALMMVGLMISSVLGAPWLIPLLFFTLALAPLYRIGLASNEAILPLENKV